MKNQHGELARKFTWLATFDSTWESLEFLEYMRNPIASLEGKISNTGS
jgi:hypothetical protein